MRHAAVNGCKYFVTSGRWSRVVALAIGVLLCAAAGRANDENGALQITDVRLGLGGSHKVGHWTPVVVSVRAGSEAVAAVVEIVVPDSDSVETVVSAGEIELAAGEAGFVTTLVKIGRTVCDLEARVINKQTSEVVRRRLPLSELGRTLLASRRWIVTIGTDVGIADTTLLESAAELPTDWHGYAGVDTIVLTTSSTEFVSNLGSDQVSAIERWVRAGGHLILAVGKNGVEAIGPNGPLTMFVPGTLVGVRSTRETVGLDTFANSAESLSEGDHRLEVAMLRDVRGRVITYDDHGVTEFPLLIRNSLSFGQVTFVAFDLDGPVITKWRGHTRLIDRLLDDGMASSASLETGSQSGQIVQVGYEDIAGQLRSALDQFDTIPLVSFSSVAMLIVLYLLLIGPADYFLLRRLVGRMEWTWVTFPLIVVMFCLLATWLVQRTKGSRLLVNQVDLIDIDVPSGMLRGTTWATIYTPRSDIFDLSLAVTPPLSKNIDLETELCWQGLPGSALGGMDGATRLTTLDGSYRITTPAQSNMTASVIGTPMLEQLPMAVASTKSLLGSWSGQVDGDSTTSLSTATDTLLHGEIVNPLSEELVDCELFYGRWVYRIKSLPAGSGQQIDSLATPKTVDHMLNQRTVIEMRDVSTAWDRMDNDVPRIMQMILFYRAAGGSDYVHLLHRFQGRLDQSHQLAAGKAILIARLQRPLAVLEQGDKPLVDKTSRSWSLVRIIMDVATEK